MFDITMREMLAAGVHFGHRPRYWNPAMRPYIYGTRDDYHIINLDLSLPMFKEALSFLQSVAERRGKILFVGTKQTAQSIVVEQATRCGMPYVDYRWLGGMLTNYRTVRQSIKRLKHLEKLVEEGALEKMIKKEALGFRRELEKLQRNLNGIKDMGGLPDVLFVIDVGCEKIAVKEAARLKIPVVGVVDTNCDPAEIDYPIPGNDDSRRAIGLYAKTVADVILAAKLKGDGVQEEIITEEIIDIKPEQPTEDNSEAQS